MLRNGIALTLLGLGLADTCCKTCEAPQEKYYSIDHTHNMCGECCMNPKYFHLYKIFEPNLAGPVAANETICTESKYSHYDSTVTHGFGPIKMTLDLYKPDEPEEEPEVEHCCTKCEAPLQKYYSIDTTHNMCGECCMNPKYFHLYKIFEPNLAGPVGANETLCAEKNYTIYDSTPTHGFGPIKMTLDLFKQPKSSAVAPMPLVV